MANRAVELVRTKSGLELVGSPKFYLMGGLASLLLGLALGAIAAFYFLNVPVSSDGRVRIKVIILVFAAVSPIAVVIGVIYLLFGRILARRRGVVFDTKVGVVTRAAGNRRVMFRAISAVRLGRAHAATKLQLILRTGDVWDLHAAHDQDVDGQGHLKKMAAEIAQVTGLALE